MVCNTLYLVPQSCFEVFGFDVMIDDDGGVWLLEVSHLFAANLNGRNMLCTSQTFDFASRVRVFAACHNTIRAYAWSTHPLLSWLPLPKGIKIRSRRLLGLPCLHEAATAHIHAHFVFMQVNCDPDFKVFGDKYQPVAQRIMQDVLSLAVDPLFPPPCKPRAEPNGFRLAFDLGDEREKTSGKVSPVRALRPS
jgi:hypothetical protein